MYTSTRITRLNDIYRGFQFEPINKRSMTNHPQFSIRWKHIIYLINLDLKFKNFKIFRKLN